MVSESYSPSCITLEGYTQLYVVSSWSYFLSSPVYSPNSVNCLISCEANTPKPMNSDMNCTFSIDSVTGLPWFTFQITYVWTARKTQYWPSHPQRIHLTSRHAYTAVFSVPALLNCTSNKSHSAIPNHGCTASFSKSHFGKKAV